MLTGHPKGLYRLFFIEMWERLAFYTMVGVLMLYAKDTERGGLGYPAVTANEIYGLYLAFVYFTPYLGGLIADRFLGYRRAVLIGGYFFALGFYLLSLYGRVTFVSGLVCLCVGNGFFKPNISVMVGNLYERGDPRRDAGFNIFYMGINIGAFLANYLAAYMRNTGGWEWVFRAAAIGMLIGVGILLWSWRFLERADRRPERRPDDVGFDYIIKWIIGPALAFGVGGYLLGKEFIPEGSALKPSYCGFLAGMIPIGIFFANLARKANPEEKPGIQALFPVYLCGATFFMVLHLNGSAMTAWADQNTDRALAWAPARFKQDALPSYYANASPDDPRPNRLNLLVAPDREVASMVGQQRVSVDGLARLTASLGEGITVREVPGGLADVPEERRAEFERRAADVYEAVKVEESPDGHGGTTLTVTPAEGAQKIKRVVFVRNLDAGRPMPLFVVDSDTYHSLYDGFAAAHGRPPVELPPGDWLQLANPELFQSLNALFVIGFTPLIVLFWVAMRRRGTEVSTARKIFIGMVLTTLSLLVMVGAGHVGDDGVRKVSWWWLVGFYAVITAGELCLSPMALSLVTKLSPKRFVGLTMGGWFLATAFGNNFSGFFGGLHSQMAPTGFFLVLAGIAGGVALIVLLMLPRLDAAIRKYGA